MRWRSGITIATHRTTHVDCPMSQTREHVLLARQVGVVPRMVVYLNKVGMLEQDEGGWNTPFFEGRIPLAVLFPHHGRHGCGGAAGGSGDGDPGDKRET